MPLVVRYSVDPSTVETWGAVRQSKVGALMKADQGTVGGSKLDLPDQGGGKTVRGLRRVYMSETDSPTDNEVIYDGRVGPRDYDRGEYTLAADRGITINLVDLNTLLSSYLIQGAKDAAHGLRPDETDVERVLWWLGSVFNGEIRDFGLVATGSPVDMDGADLRGQNGSSILRDAGLLSGKQWFLYYNEPEPTVNRIGLFYDFSRSAVFNSTLRLSNHPGDSDSDITWELDSEQPPVQHRDPSQIVTGVRVEYDGGSVFVDSDDIGLTTKTDYYVRQIVAPSANTKRESTARRLAERYLRTHQKEEDTATVRLLLPSSHVGLIKAGHRIEARFDHFEPEYRDFTWWRIQELSWAQRGRKWYWVNLEMEPAPETCPAPTAAGYYPPLGGPGPLGGSIANDTPADGVTEYFKAGEFIYQPPSNAAGHAHNVWHFPTYSMADAGSPAGFSDWAPINLGNAIYLYLTGDGTLEILTREATANPSWMDITQMDADPLSLPPGSSWDSVATTLATGVTAESVTLSIVALHPETPCSHLIRIDVSGVTVPGGRRYRGINWTPTT